MSKTLRDRPLEPLRERLLKGGIAPRHVRRYLGELEDHLTELTRCEEDAGYAPAEARLRARAQLGDDAQLADAMLKQRDFRSISARAPWLVFGVVPPFAAIGAFLVPCLTLVIVAKTHGMATPHAIMVPDWFQHFATVVVLMSNLLLGPTLAMLFVVLAQRQQLNEKWPMLGITIITLFALHLQVTFPTLDHRGGSISVGPLFLGGWRDWQAWTLRWPILLAQFFLTLAPAAVLYRARCSASQ